MLQAKPSADRIPPDSYITRIATPSEDVITVSVMASDKTGVVAGCEVSFDAGGHWHPATRLNPGTVPATFQCSHGLNPWDAMYDDLAAFKARNGGNASVMIRAIDDSCNMEQAHGEKTGKHFDDDHPPGFAMGRAEHVPVMHPTSGTMHSNEL